MTLELVKEIKEAESKAEAMLKETQQEARQILRQADSERENILQETQAAAAKKAKGLMDRAKHEAEAETEPICDEKDRQVVFLKEQALNNMAQAVALLKERVVKSHADY